MPVSPALTGMALWIPAAVSFAAPEEAAILPYPRTSMPGAGNAAPHFFDTSQQTCIPMKPESSIVHSVDKLDKVKRRNKIRTKL